MVAIIITWVVFSDELSENQIGMLQGAPLNVYLVNLILEKLHR